MCHGNENSANSKQKKFVITYCILLQNRINTDYFVKYYLGKVILDVT